MSGDFYTDDSLSQQDQVMQFLLWVIDFYRLGLISGSTVRSSNIYDHILQRVVDRFKADSGSLAFLSDSGSSLEIVAGIDLPANVIGTHVPVNNSRMGDIITNNAPRLFNDNPDNATPSRVASAMCWPIVINDSVMGALNINRNSDSTPYNNTDLANGKILIELICVVLDNIHLHNRHQDKILELKNLNTELEMTHRSLDQAKTRLLQSEKLASVGQLAAGIAHEINNPVGYIQANMSALKRYTDDLMALIDQYHAFETHLPAIDPDSFARLQDLRQQIDLGYISDDINDLITETQTGLTRIQQIVQGLRDFSHNDSAQWQWTDIQDRLDLSIRNCAGKTKKHIKIEKQFEQVPQVECMQSQITLVFNNLITNAIYAVHDEQGLITIGCGHRDDCVWISISDNGCGIDESIRNRIFEPFFTTKPVGEGTGLGLSIAYGIVEMHGGSIELNSNGQNGSCFTIRLPVNHVHSATELNMAS